MKAFDARHRLRLVDIVDVHAYVTQVTDASDAASQVRHCARHCTTVRCILWCSKKCLSDQ